MKESLPAKYIFSVIFLVLLFSGKSSAQVNRIGGGLAFTTGAEFNEGETGNPGLVLKTWIAVDKLATFNIVPSISAFNRYRLETGSMILTNYMFQGDLDAQYLVLQEGTIRLVVFGGGNITYLTSFYEPLMIFGDEAITDKSDFTLGTNLGAGLELRMSPQFDFLVSCKYLFSKYSQFIISVQGIYYFKSRRRAYKR